MARYCHLPVGNMGGDWMLDAADAMLARRLRDEGHVLWDVDPTLPDLGFTAGPENEADQVLASETPVIAEVSLSFVADPH